VAHPSFFEGWDSRVPIAGDFAFHFLISQTHRLAFGGIAAHPCAKRKGGPPGITWLIENRGHP